MTNPASTNLLAHKLILVGTVKVTTYRRVSLFPTTMATCWEIGTLIHDAQAPVVMSGDNDTRRVVGNGCIVQQPLCVVYQFYEEQYKVDKSFNDLPDGFTR